MPKSTALNNGLLNLIFQGTTLTGLAQNATTSPNTSLYFALHTASPTVGGSQTASEAAYTNYARVAVARTSSGFSTATAAAVNPVAAVSFPAATAGSETETFFSVGTAASGAGTVLYFGSISPTIAVSAGVQPVLTTSTVFSEA